LRPNDVESRIKVGESFLNLGRLPEALATLRLCTAADPLNMEANDFLGITQNLLGDRAGALASLSRTPEIASDQWTSADLLVAQFYNDVITREEFERHAETEYVQPILGQYLYALVDHPDPRQRDPEYVLNRIERDAVILSTLRWPGTVEIVARIRLEDWAGAIEAFEKRFKPQFLMLVTPLSYEFMRTLVYAHLGRENEARQAYRRGMLAWEDWTRDQTALWERSDAMRWRRAAEAALEKK